MSMFEKLTPQAIVLQYFSLYLYKDGILFVGKDLRVQYSTCLENRLQILKMLLFDFLSPAIQEKQS